MTIATSSETVPTESELRERPWWRRPRRLRRQLVGTLVATAFVSVALIGGLNFIAARQLLDEGTKEQLTAVGEARAQSIELGVDRVLGQVSAVAADLAVVEALESLTAGREALREASLEGTQLDELDAFYKAEVIGPVADAGLGSVSLDDVRPGSDAGRYLQYEYIVSAADDPDRRAEILDPGDGSAYSEIHAVEHPYLVSLAAALGLGDVMLVSPAGDIVYSVEKRIDFGTNLVEGPYRDTVLAETVLDGLSGVRVGEAVISDQELYLAARGRPVMFVAASVRRDTEIIGTLVVEVPIAALDAITTANGQWEAVGLADGESYVVGRDKLLRSESRQWIEDPQEYLDGVDDATLADLMEALGSPVGLQTVETTPVRTALDGQSFDGTARDYLGRRTFSYATPIDVAGVDWVVVADVPLRDARGPLVDYAKRIGLVLLVILPVAAFAGYWLADRLTRPIAPVVDAALAVAHGDRDPDLPDLGRDEFGDLAKRLKQMAHELGQREAALEDEFERTRKLLLTVLPSRIVGADGQVTGAGEATDIATVVAVGVAVESDLAAKDIDLGDLLGRVLELAETMASERDVERIRVAADHYLFLAGLGDGADGADQALGFAVELAPAVAALAEAEDVVLAVRLGLSTGPVATGMLEQGSLTFAAWGEPVRRALAIGSLSRSDEILVDSSTAGAATPEDWAFEPATDVMDLDGQPMAVFGLADRAPAIDGQAAPG